VMILVPWDCHRLGGQHSEKSSRPFGAEVQTEVWQELPLRCRKWYEEYQCLRKLQPVMQLCDSNIATDTADNNAYYFSIRLIIRLSTFLIQFRSASRGITLSQPDNSHFSSLIYIDSSCFTSCKSIVFL
jgi:hypothetical protein